MKLNKILWNKSQKVQHYILNINSIPKILMVINKSLEFKFFYQIQMMSLNKQFQQILILEDLKIFLITQKLFLIEQ